jgi:beta-lactamase superfamily II metal-dependent hydrolase
MHCAEQARGASGAARFVLMKIMWRSALLLLFAGLAQAASRHHLDIYFIDVGGGQATLIVTPKGESLLIDAGWPGKGGPEGRLGDAARPRDPERILAAMRDAGVSKIDLLLVTHFHRDHIGGIPELAQRVPIKTFVDYGSAYPPADRSKTDIVDAQDVQSYDDYLPVRAKAAHIQPRPGDRLPLKDVRVTVVSTDGHALPRAMRNAGDKNDACPTAPRFTSYPGDENLRSVSIVLQYGRFRFLDVGDLNGPPLFDLVCPRDLIGRVDLFLAPHHGGSGAAEPATLAALQPRAIIVNNAPRKGGRAGMLKMLSEAKGVDTWQLHLSPEGGEHNSPPQRTANVDSSTGYGFKVRASSDGSFTVINERTGSATSYSVRR